MQLRERTAHTFEEYVTGARWKTARLSACPVCDEPVISHGTYARKLPKLALIARFFCGSCHITIALLPDFYASRMPGLLAEIEDAVTIAESAQSVAAAAEMARPADEPQAVSLPSAIRWVRRRVRATHRLLATVIGLVPDRFEGCVPRVASFRERLGVINVLVALREICARSLHSLAPPLGLLAPANRRVLAIERRQQSSGPGPPPTTS